MNFLFLHQNMPGQFKYLAPHLAAAGHQVVFITRREGIEMPGIEKLLYKPARDPHDNTHPYLRQYENSVLHGQQVVRVAQRLKQQGFLPDLVIAHPGWGESLFMKDLFPTAPLLGYGEFYYGTGGDVGFNPADQISIDSLCRMRARNAHLLLSLEACDRAYSPTHWQRSRHPTALQSKIDVIFDGIDTALVKPDPAARFQLPGGRELTRGDPVVTYVARNLEPHRGFPEMVRAIPRLLERRPDADVVIVGGDEVSYGSAAPGGGSWREWMAKEVPLDPARVHFVGKLAYTRYLKLLQVSAVHVYLTYPFVLSWSFVEALAAGCAVVASRTPPVEEVIVEHYNGLLFDFFDTTQLAERVVDALDNQQALEPLRRNARETVLDRYALDRCLPRQLELVWQLTGVNARNAARHNGVSRTERWSDMPPT